MSSLCCIVLLRNFFGWPLELPFGCAFSSDIIGMQNITRIMQSRILIFLFICPFMQLSVSLRQYLVSNFANSNINMYPVSVNIALSVVGSSEIICERI